MSPSCCKRILIRPTASTMGSLKISSFQGFQFFLQGRSPLKLAGATGSVHGRPLFRGYVCHADQRAGGAETIAFGDEAVVAGKDFQACVLALQLLHRVREKLSVEGGFLEGDDFFELRDAADGFERRTSSF